MLSIIFFFFNLREEKDLKVALELAERLTKKKHTREIGVQPNTTDGRPVILKKEHQPELTTRR